VLAVWNLSIEFVDSESAISPPPLIASDHKLTESRTVNNQIFERGVIRRTPNKF